MTGTNSLQKTETRTGTTLTDAELKAIAGGSQLQKDAEGRQFLAYPPTFSGGGVVASTFTSGVFVAVGDVD